MTASQTIEDQKAAAEADQATANAEKARAEARLVDVQAERFAAEASKFKSEAAKADSEAAKVDFEKEEAKAKATVAGLMRDREVHKRGLELAADEHAFFYPFVGGVGSASVAACIKQLTSWSRTAVRDDAGNLPGIEIQFNSPGGSIIDGMALFDFIQTIRGQGFEVTTSAIGYAASMAGILLQAGDIRIIGSQSWLMIHEASFGAGGKIGEVEDTVDWVKRIQERILDIFVERSNMTKRQLKSKWTRQDWWISSDEALERGLVDKVR